MTEAGTAVHHLGESHARELAREATIFGYAIVEHFKAIWAANSPQSPHSAPAYRYTFNPRLYGPDDNLAVTANNDTIYGGCALDLRAEPAVLQVPAIADRYYSIQFIGGDTDDFAYVGTRTTGPEAATYLIAGPDWSGPTPPGVAAVLRSPTRFAIAPVRVAVSGVDDLVNVADYGEKFVLMPLSQFMDEPPVPTSAPVEWPAFFDPRTGDLAGFLDALGFMMQWHVFGPEHRPALEGLEAIGVTPGRFVGEAAFPVDVWKAMEEGFDAGRSEIAKQADNIGRVVNGWSFSPMSAGNFGTDYLIRSATAWKYIYVQAAEEAMYPTADVDGSGEQLDGTSRRYELTFPSGQLPPAKSFWSVTMYDKKDGFLVHNPIERYSIGDRTPGLHYESDGSLKITIQADAPDSGQTANWLPAPRAPFYVCMRIYGPEPVMLSGDYVVPTVERLG